MSRSGLPLACTSSLVASPGRRSSTTGPRCRTRSPRSLPPSRAGWSACSRPLVAQLGPRRPAGNNGHRGSDRRRTSRVMKHRSVCDRTGPQPAGTRWVHAEPAARGVQRARAVTTGQPSWRERSLFPGCEDQPQGLAPPNQDRDTLPAPKGLLEREQQADGHEQERGQRDPQRNQDVGGEPKAAAEVLEPNLIGVVVGVVGGRVGLLIWRGEEVFGPGVPVVGHDLLLFVEAMVASRRRALWAGTGRPDIWWRCWHHPLQN